MDLEVMEIALTADESLRELYTVRTKGQCPETTYRRKVTREANDEGKF